MMIVIKRYFKKFNFFMLYFAHILRIIFILFVFFPMSGAYAEQVPVAVVADEDGAVRLLLMEALNGIDPERIESLANAYRHNTDADPLLLQRAQAAVLRLRGRIPEAATAYRTLLAADPDDVRNRLDAGAVQFANRQWADAAHHFQAAAQQNGLPENVYANIRRFQAALSQQSRWRFALSFSPVYNSNANNAAPPHCIRGLYCSRSRAVSAKGLAYAAAAEKTTPLYGGHNLLTAVRIGGTSYYADRKSQYDDAAAEAALGWQWQNHVHSISLTPFYQIRLSGSDNFDNKSERRRRLLPYAEQSAVGVRAAFGRRLNAKLSLRLGAELAYPRHREAAAALNQNGRQESVQAALSYGNGRAAVSAAYRYSRLQPQHAQRYGRRNHHAYHRHAVHVGASAAWRGWNGRLLLGYAERRYRGTAPFSEQAQRNREYSAELTLAHDKLQWRGLMPAVGYQYSRIRSNQPWAERRHGQWLLTLEKNF